MFKRFVTVCGAALQLNSQSVIARSKRDEAISKLVFYNMARLPRFARNDVQSYFGTACRPLYLFVLLTITVNIPTAIKMHRNTANVNNTIGNPGLSNLTLVEPMIPTHATKLKGTVLFYFFSSPFGAPSALPFQ